MGESLTLATMMMTMMMKDDDDYYYLTLLEIPIQS